MVAAGPGTPGTPGEEAVVAGEPGWVPPGVDTKRANMARVYDYLLGGSHNFLADQDVGRAMAAADPNVRAIAQANRKFLGRAVHLLAASGIRQLLDIGSGIPTQGNVHEIAQAAAPGARVVYADVDPVAIAHSRAILAGDPNTAIIDADARAARAGGAAEPTGLLCGPAAVDRERRAGGHPGLRPGQPQHQLRDFGRLDQPLDRTLGQDDRFEHLVLGDAVHPRLVRDLPLYQRRADVARADAVAGHPVRGPLQGDHLGQPLQAVLGGDIGRLVRGTRAARAPN